MKTRKLLVLALSLNFATVYAQSDERVLNSDPINVDGYLHDERPASDAELESLKSTVKKYKTENVLYKEKAKTLNKVTAEAEKIGENAEEKIHAQVEAKKAEAKAMEKIAKAEAKLKCLMEGNEPEDCSQYREARPVEQSIQLSQAAPVVSTTEVAPVTQGLFEKIKLIPYIGGTSYNGKVESLEAELATGLRLESNINERFSIGLGLNYAQLKTNDFANNLPYMTPSYYGMYGLQGREIQFSSLGVDLNGKFFITNGARFRPYLGVGLGYSRSTLKYSENNQQTIPGYGMFGNEEYRTSYAVGSIMAGSEIMITPTVGINLEGAYSTGLSNGLSSKSAKNFATSPDQQRLQDLGEEIINSNALSIFAGMIIVF